jgi:hypothetical protein
LQIGFCDDDDDVQIFTVISLVRVRINNVGILLSHPVQLTVEKLLHHCWKIMQNHGLHFIFATSELHDKMPIAIIRMGHAS